MKTNRCTIKDEIRSLAKGNNRKLDSSALTKERATNSEIDEPCRRMGLTSRQTKVMSGMFFGKTDKEIAMELGISHRTVGSHIGEILRELRVSTRGAAIKVLIDAHFSCPHRSRCKLRFMAEIPPDFRLGFKKR